MSQKLLDVLTLGHCSHEFSWPRRASDGHYYQVCMLCASEYRYDWKAMRRTERVEHPPMIAGTISQPATEQHRRSTWVPRARRLKLQTPLRYRPKAQSVWDAGVIENLSQSGLLFRGSQHLIENTLVEMIFTMPEEISGQKDSNVLCQGRIIRSQKVDGDEGAVLAAAVLDYKFLHSS